MTPRPHARTRRAACSLVLMSAGLLALAGCDPRTLFYFIQPNEPTIPVPEGSPSLVGKRVAVVAHASSGAQGEFPALEREFAREFSRRLQKNVKKIDMVSQEKVWDWVDGHTDWNNPAEIARAFEADYVIFLEIESFKTKEAGDLNVLHGTSRTHIQAIALDYPKNSRGKRLTDQPKEEETVYDDYQETEFPKRGPIPTDTGTSAAKFKKTFLKVVAVECTWHFLEHAPEDAIGDTRINDH
ncbi:MAG: hypothetical protein P4L84_31535 [Isosphaeraceae bacterium]|nr:hypothetical protein [Isosphaeraceae bacterium]